MKLREETRISCFAVYFSWFYLRGSGEGCKDVVAFFGFRLPYPEAYWGDESGALKIAR
jgi:hypothetical protein